MSSKLRVALPLLLVALSACGGGEAEDPVRACLDGVISPGETDVDCGGPCSPCLDGQACERGTDCTGGVCHEGSCLSPSCTDAVTDGDESDVDCGGSCGPCGDGAACSVAADCASGACEAGVCAPVESCSDGLLNQDETDVDCGGACAPCGTGSGCVTGDDCASGYCGAFGSCATAPTCEDGKRNAGETDIDCGGPDCDPCADDRTCLVASDCVSDVCVGGLCGEPPGAHCSNDVVDGDETDVDCGGSCGICPLGYACESGADCSEGMGMIPCYDGMCGGVGTCEDQVPNGHETDQDCGGVFCPPCFGGQACQLDSDCASGTCLNGACTDVADTCDNGVQDGFETDVDCGGNCAGCPDGYFCDRLYDCEGQVLCGLVTGNFTKVCGDVPPCENGQLDGHETDVDCGGLACEPCGADMSCLDESDCASGICTDGVCAQYAPTCGDGILNGTETDVDCGGPACLTCEDGQTCLQEADCASYACVSPDRTTHHSCAFTAASLQRTPESLQCTSQDQTALVSTGHPLRVVVTSPRLQPAEGVDAYYVAPVVTWSPADQAYMGLLLELDTSLGLAPQVGTVLEVVGDHVEADCMTVLKATTATVVDALATVPGVVTLDPTLLAQGGTADVEPWEGVAVRIEGVLLSDTAGGDGWWIQVGEGIRVSDDFGVASQVSLSAVGTSIRVTGFVQERGGVYAVVPRRPSDVVSGVTPPR